MGRASLRTSHTHTHIANTTSLSPKSWLKTPSASFCSLSATISDGTTGARRNQPRFHLAGPKKSPKKKVKARPALPLHAPRSTPVRAPLRSPHTEPQKQPAWQGKRSRWCWHLTRFAGRFFFFSSLLQNEQKTHGKQRSPTRDPAREVFLPSPAATHLEIWALPRNLARGGGSGFALRLLAWLSQHPFCLHSSGPGRKAL